MRTPTSAPFERTRSGAGVMDRLLFGSTLVVTPRRSLVWNPSPALPKRSVLKKGPTTKLAFGLVIEARGLPELSGVSPATVPQYSSWRRPRTVRSQGVHLVVFWT